MQTEVSKTKMVANTTPTETTVKLKVERRVLYKDQELSPGHVFEVPYNEAKELLKMSVEGQYDFSGEVDKIAKKPRIHFYSLIKEPTPMDELSLLQTS